MHYSGLVCIGSVLIYWLRAHPKSQAQSYFCPDKVPEQDTQSEVLNAASNGGIDLIIDGIDEARG